MRSASFSQVEAPDGTQLTARALCRMHELPAITTMVLSFELYC